jgi:hypothetical protein
MISFARVLPRLVSVDEGECTKNSRIEAMYTGTFGVSIACVSRKTLWSDWYRSLNRMIVNLLVTKELLALFRKRSTDFGGNEFAEM